MSYEWSMFTDRLEAVLTQLAKAQDPGAVLIISDSREPSCYVQFLCGGDVEGIWAEAANDKDMPADRRFSDEDKKRLAADGWKKPSRWWQAPKVVNWSYCPDPDDVREYRRTAEMAVTALQLMKIKDPGQLVYHAFGAGLGEPITLDQLQLPRKADQ